jgi:transposase InsO family protein
MDQILKNIYYDPETGLQGARSLYQKAVQQDKSITQKAVDEWLKRQETQQVHTTPSKIKHYYPIKANEQDHIWQADLMDVSAQAHNNGGVNYFLCVIDIWSRFAWVRLLKNKTNKSATDAFHDILRIGRSPQILMTDNGSEFISRSWKQLLKDNNIRASYAEPGDHHRMGIVERFNKTIRGMITKYMTAFKTKRFIDIVPKLLKNYNATVHSSIGSTPSNPNKSKIEAIVKDKEDKARNDLTEFAIGDKVRSLKNKVMFEKGAIPKWSQTVHTVTGYLASKRYILDNDKSYLYYQLKPADVVDTFDGLSSEEVIEPEQPLEKRRTRQTDKDLRSGKTVRKEAVVPISNVIEPKRTRLALKKEGVEKTNLRPGLRERVPTSALVTNKGERINW